MSKVKNLQKAFVVFLIAIGFGFQSLGQISGLVYKDYDGNGKMSLVNPYEPGIPDMKIRIFVGKNPVPVETLTDDDGNYVFTATQAPKDSLIRVEFVHLDGFYDGCVGTASNTSVQFVKGGATKVDLGVMNDDVFCTDGKGVTITTPCYTNGDPLKNGTAAATDAVVVFPYESSGVASPTNYPPDHLAYTYQVGSLWSSTYQKASKMLLFGALVRRHAGLGALGTGGIYSVNLKTKAVAPFLDLKKIGIDTGPDPHKKTADADTTELPKDMTTSNHDSLTFQMAGKVGFSGMQLTRFADTIMIVNLYDRRLYSFKVGKPLVAPSTPAQAAVESWAIPHPNCSNNDFRPWALKHRRGKMYLGVVCSAETSQDTNDLKAAVYIFDPKQETFTKILDVPLNYKRDPADASGPDCYKLNKWLPWTDKFPKACNLPSTTPAVLYPQPILSDIEFDEDESLLLGFLDRFGLQGGQQNWGIAKNDTMRYSSFMSGDILRAQYKNGTYTLESNGKSGKFTGCGVGKGTGPGGGEFFCADEWIFYGNVGHGETANGGMFKLPGRREIVTSAMDPVDSVYNAAGFRTFSTVNGKYVRGFAIYANQPGTLGKAGGTGDLTGLCDQAPLEIGNRIWFDKNRNGVQDPDEKGIDNLVVSLYDMSAGGSGVLAAKDTTTGGGFFYFKDKNVPGGLKRNANYEVRVDMSQRIPLNVINPAGSATQTVALSDSLGLSPKDAVTYPQDPDMRDSDGAYNADSTLAVMKILTGNDGENNHALALGFMLDIKGTIGDFVWKDANNNGRQDTGEKGVRGIILELCKAVNGVASGAAIARDTTDANGKYLFTNLDKGQYIVKILKTSLPPNCVVSDSTNKGTDDKDTDFTKACISPVVTLDPEQYITNPLLQHNLTIDAALITLGSIGDFVWKDDNNNGVQDAGEQGVKDVILELYRAVNGVPTGAAIGKDTTDAAGKYLFSNLPKGSYVVKVVTSSIPASLLLSPLSNVGADATNSDFTTAGISKGITLDPDNATSNPLLKDNIAIDAALYLPCIKPAFTLTPQSATCSGTTANNDAKILATAVTSGSSYSFGRDSTAFTFSSSTTFSSNLFTIQNIPNPSVATIYFVRIYNGKSDCYTTKIVTIQPTNCAGPCIKPTFTPTTASATCSNGTANSDAKILVSGVANGSSYVYGTDSTTFSPTAAVIFTGNSFTVNGLANPTADKIYYVRIYNSATCFTTKTVTLKPIDCTIPKVDIEVRKEVIGSGIGMPCVHNFGDEIKFRIIVSNKATNPLAISENVIVADTLASNFTYIGAKATQGTYNKAKNTWGPLMLMPGRSDTLVITVQLTLLTGQEGNTVGNKAEVISATGIDIDSQPNNHVTTEDDQATAYITVPMKLCPAQKDTVMLTAPAGYMSYQWCRNGVNIAGATNATYDATQGGEYTVKINGTNNCPTKNCCPMLLIEECICLPKCVPYTVKRTKIAPRK